MLDFVPNHTGAGSSVGRGPSRVLRRRARRPTWRARRRTTRGSSASSGDLLLAHGRDPYFPGWPDTLQLDYGNPATQEAMIGELLKIAGQCDGVRCDMAMLVLPDVFERTWGRRAPPFWPEAIRRVRERAPGFRFMAEVYWDLEWTMLQQGFDYAYDKRLYDRLRDGHARPVREHLHAGLDYQDKLARFLENHDEPRAAATFAAARARGRRRHHLSVAGPAILPPGPVRGPPEAHLAASGPGAAGAGRRRAGRPSTTRLLAVLRQPVVRDGQWRLLDCAPAWDGNWTWDGFIAWAWDAPGRRAPPRGRQLRRQSGAVLRPAAVSRPGRPLRPAPGPARSRRVRSRRGAISPRAASISTCRHGGTTCSR